jgi:phosphotransferase system IIA component
VVEKVPLTAMEDEGIRTKWGDNIYRINFNLLHPKASDKVRFIVTTK